jgi:hypothetical protein
LLSEQQVDQVVQFIQGSRSARQASWDELANIFDHFGVSPQTIRDSLKRRGYRRYVARAKPPLSPRTRALRLQWALDHIDWDLEQWLKVLWSDETWVKSGRHHKIWVTHLPGEELDLNCVVEKRRKTPGWMFWACFSGGEKGPCLFWEKEWGTITNESYREHVTPLVQGWCRLRPGLIFMQDNASAHKKEETLQDLRERGVTIMSWPPNSPDLNPIEAVWCQMKDYIQWKYGDQVFSYNRLREIVREAWDSITEEQLLSLVKSMKERCQAVINAQGGHTKY